MQTSKVSRNRPVLAVTLPADMMAWIDRASKKARLNKSKFIEHCLWPTFEARGSGKKILARRQNEHVEVSNRHNERIENTQQEIEMLEEEQRFYSDRAAAAKEDLKTLRRLCEYYKGQSEI